MQDLTDVRWKVGVASARVISVQGYPEDHKTFWIETEHGIQLLSLPPLWDKGIRLIEQEEATANYIVELHNLNWKVRYDQKVAAGEAKRGRGRPKEIRQVQDVTTSVGQPNQSAQDNSAAASISKQEGAVEEAVQAEAEAS